MSSVFPASIDNNITLPLVANNSTPVSAATVNNLQGAIIAIETTLGTSPQGSYGTVSNRLTTLEGTIGNLQIISLTGDLGGTLTDPLVIGIQGRPVSNAIPMAAQVLSWNGIAWTPTTLTGGTFALGGDLGGTQTSQLVIGIHGQPVPAPTGTDTLLTWNGTALVWAISSASWSAGGDLSGNNTSQTVIAIHGTSVPATPTANQVLVATSGTASTWEQIANAQVSNAAAIAYSKLNLTGNVVNTDISSSANITVTKLAAGAAAQVLLNNGTPAPTWTTLSGGATVSDTGVVTLSSASITLAGDVTGAANANTVGKIQGNTVSAASPTNAQTLVYNGSAYVNEFAPLVPVLFSDLSTLVPLNTTQTVSVDGYYSAGDGAGDLFDWNNTSTATPDVNTVKVIGITTGRWIRRRIDSSWYNVKWFGVYGDGVHDDTAAIQLGINTVPEMGTLFFPAGTYLVSSPLLISESPIILDGAIGPATSAGMLGQATLQQDFTNPWAGPLLVIDGNFNLGPPFPVVKVGNFYCLEMSTLASNSCIDLSDTALATINGLTTGTSNLTFECWVNPMNNDPSASLTTIAASGGGRDVNDPTNSVAFALGILPGYALSVTLNTTGGLINYDTTNKIAANALTHVAVCYTESTGQLNTFINGVLDPSSTATIPGSTVIQNPWEDFCIGSLSKQWCLASQETGINGTLQIASIRLSFVVHYTANFTPSTTELTPTSSTQLLINFDPANMAFAGGTYVIGQTTNYSGIPSPVYLYLARGSDLFIGMLGTTVRNLNFSCGDSGGEAIFATSGNYQTFENLTINASLKGITIIGGYGHYINRCRVSVGLANQQCHNWPIGLTDNSGGTINIIENCTLAGGTVSIALPAGGSVVNTFISGPASLMGICACNLIANLGSLIITNVLWDDESGISIDGVDCGIYVSGMDQFISTGNSYLGTGSGTEGPMYKIGNCGTVQLSDNYFPLNSALPGILHFVYPNVEGSPPVVMNNVFRYTNPSNIPVLDPDGYGAVIIPTQEAFGVLTLNFASDADMDLAGDSQLWGTLIITDTTPYLSTGRNVIFKYLTAGYKRRVVNQTAQTLTFKGTSGASVSVVTNTSATIYCTGTGWIYVNEFAPLVPVLFSDLSTLVPLNTTQTVNVDGYGLANDGGGGLFNWNASSTATPVAGYIAEVTGITTGRWIRQLADGNAFNVKMFGAKGDGSTNDEVAFATGNTVAGVGGQLVVPPGNYIISSDIIIIATLVMQPGAVLSPINGSIIILNNPPIAPTTQQIFNTFSFNGNGVNALTIDGYVYFGLVSEVYADWWQTPSQPSPGAGYESSYFAVQCAIWAAGYASTLTGINQVSNRVLLSNTNYTTLPTGSSAFTNNAWLIEPYEGVSITAPGYNQSGGSSNANLNCNVMGFQSDDTWTVTAPLISPFTVGEVCHSFTCQNTDTLVPFWFDFSNTTAPAQVTFPILANATGLSVEFEYLEGTITQNVNFVQSIGSIGNSGLGPDINDGYGAIGAFYLVEASNGQWFFNVCLTNSSFPNGTTYNLSTAGSLTTTGHQYYVNGYFNASANEIGLYIYDRTTSTVVNNTTLSVPAGSTLMFLNQERIMICGGLGNFEAAYIPNQTNQGFGVPGTIDNIRISNVARALTPPTTRFNPSGDSNLVLLMTGQVTPIYMPGIGNRHVWQFIYQNPVGPSTGPFWMPSIGNIGDIGAGQIELKNFLITGNLILQGYRPVMENMKVLGRSLLGYQYGIMKNCTFGGGWFGPVAVECNYSASCIMIFDNCQFNSATPPGYVTGDIFAPGTGNWTSFLGVDSTIHFPGTTVLNPNGNYAVIFASHVGYIGRLNSGSSDASVFMNHALLDDEGSAAINNMNYAYWFISMSLVRGFFVQGNTNPGGVGFRCFATREVNLDIESLANPATPYLVYADPVATPLLPVNVTGLIYDFGAIPLCNDNRYVTYKGQSYPYAENIVSDGYLIVGGSTFMQLTPVADGYTVSAISIPLGSQVLNYPGKVSTYPSPPPVTLFNASSSHALALINASGVEPLFTGAGITGNPYIMILPAYAQIITGTGNNYTLEPQASVQLVYNNILSVWSLISASSVVEQNVPVSPLQTSNYQVKKSDYFIGFGTLSGPVILTLPANPNTGDTYIIKDVNGTCSGTNTITITPSAGNIDGASIYVMNAAYSAVTVTFTSLEWSIT